MGYTREQIETALEGGADLVKDGLGTGGLGERDCDLIDLVLNAVRDRLDNPQTTLDQVITNHGENPAEVRSHWGSWD